MPHRTEIFDALLLKFGSWALINKIDLFPFTYVQPGNFKVGSSREYKLLNLKSGKDKAGKTVL